MKPNEVLKQLRESKGCTIQEISKKIGMQYSVCREYESGDRNLGMSAAIKFADFYGVSIDYLMGREQPPQPIDQLERQFNMSALEKKIVDNYLSLPKELRMDLMDFLKKSVNEIMNEETSD